MDWYVHFEFWKVWRCRSIRNSRLLLFFRCEDVYMLSKWPWFVLQCETHMLETEEAVWRPWSSWMEFPFAIWTAQYLPFTSNVEKYLCLTKWLDKFIHVRYSVWVLDCHCDQIQIVDAKVYSSVFLQNENNRCYWSRLSGSNSIHGEHSTYL